MSRKANPGKYAVHRMIGKFLMRHLPHQRNFTARTVGTYREGLARYRDYLAQEHGIKFADMAPEHFSAPMVSGFAAWLKGKGQSDSTVGLRLSTIRSFLKFCASEDIAFSQIYAEVDASVRFKPSPRKEPVKHLTGPQLRLLFSMPDPSTRTGFRDRFFLVLAYETGARLSELLSLRLGDIREADGCVTVRIEGKGRKTRSVPLPKDARPHLEAYLRRFHHGSGPDAFLFYTRHQGLPTQMREGAVDNMMRKYGAMAHKADPSFPPSIHCHMLRHSLAMALYRRGVPLEFIRDILGHAQTSTTGIYAVTTMEMMKEAMEKAGRLKAGSAGGGAIAAPEAEEELLKKLSTLP